MNVLEEAILFATEAHEGQVRKMAGTPYILHPLEVAAIIATLTDDVNTMAAGVLHDTVEDCGADPRELRRRFGPRVAALVQAETEDRTSDRPAEETWKERKEESLLALEHTPDRDVRILWLADKLSNMRSFWREWRKRGDEMWQHLHQKDPAMQGWYYKSIARYLKEFDGTAAYAEYVSLVKQVFGEGDQDEI